MTSNSLKHQGFHLKKHRMSVHETITYQCDQCELEFTHRSYLKIHKMSVHQGNKYQCDQCNLEFTRRSNLQRHKMSDSLSIILILIWQVCYKSSW